MPRGLPISTVVNVNTAIQAGGVLRQEFGQGLLVTTDDAIAAGGSGKMQAFADYEGVNEVFDDEDVLAAAEIWFGADPLPKSLNIGRWATADVPTTLRGGTPGAIADLAVGNAAFVVDGVTVTANLAAATTYAAIAAAIQAALTMGPTGALDRVNVTTGGTGYTQATTTVAFSGGGATRQATGTVVVTGGAVTAIMLTDAGAGYTSAPTVTITDTGSGTGAAATAVLVTGGVTPSLANATFTYDTDAFLLTLASAADIPATFGSPATGTDISALLGMASGATYAQGHDEESLADALGEMIALASGGAPVALMLADDAPDMHNSIDSWEALASYAQAGDFVAGILDISDQALVTGDDTSRAALVFERGQSHAAAVYSMPGERPDIGLMAAMSAQNLNQPASIITPHLKVLPNVAATRITTAQLAELERKRTNVYTTIAGLPALFGGFTGKAGSWLDAVWFLLFWKNEMELAIYNAQRASRRFNTAILADEIDSVNRTMVLNGGLMPGGTVSAATKQDIITTTGNQDFDGTLTTGYLTWIEQPSARSQADRESRVGRFKTWAVGSDAIHKVFGDIILSG